MPSEEACFGEALAPEVPLSVLFIPRERHCGGP
jgi:hypothetical protein